MTKGLVSRLILGARGFTLIELVMIIILLAILSAVAVPRFINLITPSRENITRQEMETLRKAMVGDPGLVAGGAYSSRGFRGDVGRFPTAGEGLPALATNPGVPAWNRYTKTGWNGPYVDAGVGDEYGPTNSYLRDAWGNNYEYQPTNNPPRIVSRGPNGILESTAGNPCGGDDICVELNY